MYIRSLLPTNLDTILNPLFSLVLYVLHHDNLPDSFTLLETGITEGAANQELRSLIVLRTGPEI